MGELEVDGDGSVEPVDSSLFFADEGERLAAIRRSPATSAVEAASISTICSQDIRVNYISSRLGKFLGQMMKFTSKYSMISYG